MLPLGRFGGGVPNALHLRDLKCSTRYLERIYTRKRDVLADNIENTGNSG